MTALLVCLLLNPGIFQQPTITATVSGNRITVAWTIPPGRPTADWIGVFPKGSATGFVDWVYISGSRTEGPVAGATHDFTVPAGEWDIRYVDSTSGALYVPLATALATVGVPVDPVDPPPDDPIPQPNVPWRLDAKIVKADGTEVVQLPVFHFSFDDLTSDLVRRFDALAVGETLHWQSFRGMVVFEETPKFVGSTKNQKE